MTVLTSIVLGILVAAAGLCLLRLLRGESLPDRTVALDTLLVIIVCGLAVGAARTGSGIYLDVMVVAADGETILAELPLSLGGGHFVPHGNLRGCCCPA